MLIRNLDVNRESLKKKNRGMVLQYIATGVCGSRIDLSRKLSLTKTAISRIVAEMIENGFLEETKKQENAEPGRNPIGLDISPEAPKAAGILVMRGYCEAVLCDMKLNILKSDRVYRQWNSSEELMETVYGLIDQMLFQEENVGGIGVASIGPLDSREGIIVNPGYFNGIRHVEIRRLLTERYGLPVFCDNDNQSAALTEKLFGNGRDYQDILLVGVSNGVGCGIIVDNGKYRSYSGYTPEIGHVSIDYRGPECPCGSRGCLELYLSSPTVLKRMQEDTGKFYSYRMFCDLSEMPEIDRILRDLVEKLLTALVSVVNILNPGLIILGHDAVWWPDKYLEMIEEEVNRKKFSNRDSRTKVKRAYYLEKTAVLGAVCNVLSQYFDGNLL